MSEKTVLVIDDSATIRRLVDTELTAAGFRVILAPNAEDGIEKSKTVAADLILLDHQLPGTTGFEVCCHLVADDVTKDIPVVISSTLRNKAYAEYVDLSNVVDMLPKPYTPEMLQTTVNNAIETAAMIVKSQSDGSAVPEVISEQGDADLTGSFSCFSIRELIDFLNNSAKKGCLEIDTSNGRIQVYIDQGRILAASASGIPVTKITDKLPEGLSDLAPMVKFTLGGRSCSELDGLVELLNNKVIDPRLLRQLLRHQAAVLLGHCFEQKLKAFRFDSGRACPTLFTKLPLDISLVALLVEASSLESGQSVPECSFIRNAVRGQNLDRAGLSSQHMKVLNLVNSAVSVEQVSRMSGLDLEEAGFVLAGFEKCELVRREDKSNTKNVVLVSLDSEKSQLVSEAIKQNLVAGKVVRDLLAVKLMLRRNRPDLILVDLERENAEQLVSQIANLSDQLEEVALSYVVDSEESQQGWDEQMETTVWPNDLDGFQNLFEASESPSEPVDCV